MKSGYLIAAITIIIALFIAGCSAKEPAGTASREMPAGTPDGGAYAGQAEQNPSKEIVIDVPEEGIPDDIPKEKETEPAKDTKKEAAKKEAKAENTVKIKEDGFYPQDITIYREESVTWAADVEKISGNQPRRIACYYKDGPRLFLGERLTEKGQKSTFKFEKDGDYLCQEIIYGFRGNVKVKSISRPAITGAVIGLGPDNKFMQFLGRFLKW